MLANVRACPLAPENISGALEVMATSANRRVGDGAGAGDGGVGDGAHRAPPNDLLAPSPSGPSSCATAKDHLGRGDHLRC